MIIQYELRVIHWYIGGDKKGVQRASLAAKYWSCTQRHCHAAVSGLKFFKIFLFETHRNYAYTPYVLMVWLWSIVIVKKTFRFSYVFLYYRNYLFLQPLMPHSLFRNINMEKGINKKGGMLIRCKHIRKDSMAKAKLSEKHIAGLQFSDIFVYCTFSSSHLIVNDREKWGAYRPRPPARWYLLKSLSKTFDYCRAIEIFEDVLTGIYFEYEPLGYERKKRACPGIQS